MSVFCKFLRSSKYRNVIVTPLLSNISRSNSYTGVGTADGIILIVGANDIDGADDGIADGSKDG